MKIIMKRKYVYHAILYLSNKNNVCISGPPQFKPVCSRVNYRYLERAESTTNYTF